MRRHDVCCALRKQIELSGTKMFAFSFTLTSDTLPSQGLKNCKKPCEFFEETRFSCHLLPCQMRPWRSSWIQMPHCEACQSWVPFSDLHRLSVVTNSKYPGKLADLITSHANVLKKCSHHLGIHVLFLKGARWSATMLGEDVHHRCLCGWLRTWPISAISPRRTRNSWTERNPLKSEATMLIIPLMWVDGHLLAVCWHSLGLLVSRRIHLLATCKTGTSPSKF